MGLTYAAIELTNQFDEYKYEEGEIAEWQVRRWSGECMVDTGAVRLAINEEIKEKLGLRRGQQNLLYRRYCIAW